MCLLLTIISIPISYYHHYTIFLWILINVTLLLTIRTYIMQNFAVLKSLYIKTARYLKNHYDRLTMDKTPSTNFNRSVDLPSSPAAEFYRNRHQNYIAPVAQKPNYKTQNGPSLRPSSISDFPEKLTEIGDYGRTTDEVDYEERNVVDYVKRSVVVDYERKNVGVDCETKSEGDVFIGEQFRKSLSPTDRILRKPLRPVSSFESSGYGSPPVVSTPLTGTPSVFLRNISPATSKFATSTPVDQWQSQRDTYRLGY